MADEMAARWRRQRPVEMAGVYSSAASIRRAAARGFAYLMDRGEGELLAEPCHKVPAGGPIIGILCVRKG